MPKTRCNQTTRAVPRKRTVSNMNMTKREKSLITIVLVLALLCAYYLFFFKPFYEDLKIFKSDKTSKELQVTTYEDQVKQIEALDKQIEENEALISVYDGVISEGCDQPPLLVYLEKTVNDHADKIMFSFGDIVQHGQLQALPATATMTCSYDGLKQVLSAFADDTYFIKVTRLDTQYSSVYAEPDSADTDAEGEPADTPATDDTEAELEVIGYELNVTMQLEFYNISGDIPADTVYTFDDDITQFGGDIFY